MKAIKIDVEKQDVYQIEIEKGLDSIYSAIGNNCTTFACPVEFPNNDAMYVDDESLLRDDIKGGFIMPDWVTPIIGNAIILGTDDEGDSMDHQSTIDDIKSNVHFLDINRLLRYRDDALSRGPVIYSF